jgi:hypothetical protein
MRHKLDLKIVLAISTISLVSFVAGGFVFPEARSIYRSIEGVKYLKCIEDICIGQEQLYATDQIGRKIGSKLSLSYVGCSDWSAKIITFPGFLYEKCESDDYYYAFDRAFDSLYFKFKGNILVEISTRPRFYLTL